MKKTLSDLIEEVSFLQKQMNQNDFDRKKLEKEKEDKKIKIDELYKSKIIEKINNSKAEYKQYLEISNIILKYSSFDINILGPILADLMTKIENEKYSYYTLEYSYKEDVGIWDHNTVDCEEKAAVISKESERANLEIACLIKDDYDSFPYEYKHCCLLDSINNSGKNYIYIYEGHNERNLNDEICLEVKLAFPFLNYQKPYVKDFIDYVIDIRIKNELKEISHEQLEEFLNEFLKNYEAQKDSSQKSKKKVKKIDK